MEHATLQELLEQYYIKLFPHKKFFRWLNYGGTAPTALGPSSGSTLSTATHPYFSQREFSFTLMGTDKSEIYLRYQSFADDQEFKKELVKLHPIKIDIGAVFSVKPKEHKLINSAAFQPLEKELVFDIDLTDYDDIRTCCQEANVCANCWKFITIAMRILDSALREDFGFKHLMWVYSGRRGVHCWVGDKRARELSSEGRTAVAEYLSVLKGGEQRLKKVYFPNELHPSLQRAWRILESYFEPVIIDQQNLLGDLDRCKKLLDLVPDPSIRDRLLEQWKSESSSATSNQRWRDLCQALEDTRLRRAKQEIIFQYAYPRLDINVSKQIHHLLKAPFCVHPKTGRICIPMDMETCDTFDPTRVPCLVDVFHELDQALSTTELSTHDHLHATTENGTTERKLPYYEYTSLKPSIQLFDRFILGLEEETRLSRLKQRGKITKTHGDPKTEW